jgi:hypothetical protein
MCPGVQYYPSSRPQSECCPAHGPSGVEDFGMVDGHTRKCLTQQTLDECHQNPPRIAPMMAEGHPLLRLQTKGIENFGTVDGPTRKRLAQQTLDEIKIPQGSCP